MELLPRPAVDARVCTIMPGRVQHAIHEREGERQEREEMFFIDWFFCFVLMESYGTDFSLVLGVSWGIIKLPPTNLQAFLGSPRHHCQCRAAMCSITAPEVECDITPHCDIVCPSWILVEGHKM